MTQDEDGTDDRTRMGRGWDEDGTGDVNEGRAMGVPVSHVVILSMAKNLVFVHR